MDKSCELLPPSEALPGFGDHSVIFHNGRGFYYACREFSASLEKRQFECVRLGCGVTAIMGPEVGSPLQDQGCHSHSHPADWDYRDKCLLLHTIKQRFLRESSSASLILQEILSSLPTLKDEEENETTGDFESITIEEISPYELIKQEPILDPIYENSEPELDESSILVQPSKTYSRVGRRKKLMSEQAPLKGEEEEEKEEEEDNPAFLVIKEEICERLGAQEESVANPIMQEHHNKEFLSHAAFTKSLGLVRALVQGKVADRSRGRKRERPAQGTPEERINGKPHFLGRKEKGSCRCVVCYKRGTRKETVYFCTTCTAKPALHPDSCFEIYHTSQNY